MIVMMVVIESNRLFTRNADCEADDDAGDDDDHGDGDDDGDGAGAADDEVGDRGAVAVDECGGRSPRPRHRTVQCLHEPRWGSLVDHLFCPFRILLAMRHSMVVN